jgi:hypothetical protein
MELSTNPLMFMLEFLVNIINILIDIYDFLISDLPFDFFGANTYFDLFFGVGLVSILGVLAFKALFL